MNYCKSRLHLLHDLIAQNLILIRVKTMQTDPQVLHVPAKTKLCLYTWTLNENILDFALSIHGSHEQRTHLYNCHTFSNYGDYENEKAAWYIVQFYAPISILIACILIRFVCLRAHENHLTFRRSNFTTLWFHLGYGKRASCQRKSPYYFSMITNIVL